MNRLFNSRKKMLATLLCSALFALNMGTYESNAQTITRIGGKNRYETSMYVSDYHKSDTAVIVSGHDYPDALSAITLANRYNANIILCDNSKIYDEQMKFTGRLKNNGVKNIYIVGGYKSIDKSYDDILSRFFKVERISGENRFDTSLNVVRKSGYKDVCVASGYNYADALSGSGLIAKTNSALLLIDGKNQENLPDNLNPIYTIGGPESVKKDFGIRINGKDRYDTCEKILEIVNPNKKILVSGLDYPDALSAASFAGTKDMSVILCRKRLDQEAVRMTGETEDVTVVGGINSVSGLTVNALIDKNKATYKTNDENAGKIDDYSENPDKVVINPDGSRYKGWRFEYAGDNSYNLKYYGDDGVLVKDKIYKGWKINENGIAIIPSNSLFKVAYRYYTQKTDEKFITPGDFKLSYIDDGCYEFVSEKNADRQKDKLIITTGRNFIKINFNGVEEKIYNADVDGPDNLEKLF